MGPFHILMLSAGSLLGQNVLDNLENRRSRVRITGLNSEVSNPRIFRCDKVYKSPLLNSDNFEDFITEIVKKEQPDMILPGRDADVLLLAGLAEKYSDMKRLIPGGSLKAAQIMDNKWESHLFAARYGLPFAPSFLPAGREPVEVINWACNFGFPILAKPLGGFGSLGVKIICDVNQLIVFLNKGTDGMLLQKILGPGDKWSQNIKTIRAGADSGIPLFTYLTDENQYASQTIIYPDGTLGRIFASRNLMVIGRCERSEICNDADFIKTTEKFAASIADEGWRGMFNLQCRKTESGYYGFEMNGRMSGGTSARGWLGYDEIRELIKGFYGLDIGRDDRYPDKSSGIVFRSLTDYFTKDEDIRKLENDGVWIKPPPVRNSSRKKLLITGSTGYLGQRLIDLLIEKDRYEISVITGNTYHARSLFGNKISNYYLRDDIENNRIENTTDALIHCGFARPHAGNAEIASSLRFTNDLFSKANELGIRSIINVSSKSVYSSENIAPYNECSLLGPESVYGGANLASELFLKSTLKSNPEIDGTSIRLSTISGAGEGLVDVFFLSKFVIKALKGEKISIIGGKQEFDILDISDAACALAKLINAPCSEWKCIYNLGSKTSYNIIYLAELAVDIASGMNGGKRSEISIDEKCDIHMKHIIDSSLFRNDFCWEQKVKIEETVRSLAKHYMKKQA